MHPLQQIQFFNNIFFWLIPEGRHIHSDFLRPLKIIGCDFCNVFVKFFFFFVLDRRHYIVLLYRVSVQLH